MTLSLRELLSVTELSTLTKSPNFTRNIVSIQSHETFYDALYLMNKYHILSLCCMEETDRSSNLPAAILGFLSNLDILFYISEALLLFEFEGLSSNVMTLEYCLSRSIRDLMYQKLETEHYHLVSDMDTLMNVITGKFAQGVHRAIIIRKRANQGNDLKALEANSESAGATFTSGVNPEFSSNHTHNSNVSNTENQVENSQNDGNDQGSYTESNEENKESNENIDSQPESQLKSTLGAEISSVSNNNDSNGFYGYDSSNAELLGMISQSDIIKFAVNSEWEDEPFDIVSFVEKHWTGRNIVSLYGDDTLKDALQQMSTYSVSAVAIVDRPENGGESKLIGNFSASDLRSIIQEFSEDQSTGKTVTLSQYFNMKIVDYLQKCSKASLNPITVSIQDKTLSMRKIVNLFAERRIHRVWIVDENMVPRGVITLTDLCQFVAQA